MNQLPAESAFPLTGKSPLQTDQILWRICVQLPLRAAQYQLIFFQLPHSSSPALVSSWQLFVLFSSILWPWPSPPASLKYDSNCVSSTACYFTRLPLAARG